MKKNSLRLFYYNKISHNLGVKDFSSKLNALLIRHIEKRFFLIRDKIASIISQKKIELNSLGVDIDFEDPKGAKAVMFNIITKFISIFKDYNEDNFVKQSTNIILGGSTINYVFHNTLLDVFDILHPLKTLTNDDLRTCIKKTIALSPSL